MRTTRVELHRENLAEPRARDLMEAETEMVILQKAFSISSSIKSSDDLNGKITHENFFPVKKRTYLYIVSNISQIIEPITLSIVYSRSR